MREYAPASAAMLLEVTLFEYQGLDTLGVGERFDQLMDLVARVGGVFVFLWHNSSLDELVCPGARGAYEELIKSLAVRQLLGMSVAEAVQRVQQRFAYDCCDEWGFET